jgi:hypothetical protein
MGNKTRQDKRRKKKKWKNKEEEEETGRNKAKQAKGVMGLML